MSKLIKTGMAAGVWIALMVILGFRASYFELFGIGLFPIVGMVFSFLSIWMPGFFSMGVSGQKDAFLLEELTPLVLVGAILWALSCIPRTYAVVFVNSMLIGNSIGYIAFLVKKYTKIGGAEAK